MSFASFPLSTVGLTTSQLTACEKSGFHNASDILLTPQNELNKRFRHLTPANIASIVSTTAKAIVPKSSRVSDLLSVLDEEENLRREINVNSKDKRRERMIVGEGVISTGDSGLDGALGGGVRLGVLTEIAGESASGKSHLSMSLSIASQLPSLSTYPGGSIILTSERELSTDRLVQLAKGLLASHDPSSLADGGGGILKRLLDNVHTNRCTDVEALDHALTYMVPHMLSLRNQGGGLHGMIIGGEKYHLAGTDQIVMELGNGPTSKIGSSSSSTTLPIRLIVLDSIAALFRGSDTAFSSSADGLAQRSKFLCTIADKLKAIAVDFNIAILVINQVSDVFTRGPISNPNPKPSQIPTQSLPATQYHSSQPSASYYQHQFYAAGPEPPMLYSTQSRWFSGQTDVLQKEASLGIVWANCVNVRVMLSRTGRRRVVGKEKLSAASGMKRARTHSAHKDHDDVQPDTSRLQNPRQNPKNWNPDLDENQPVLIRRFHVVFSPFAAPSTIDYIITTSGLHSIDGSFQVIDQASFLKRIEKKEAKARLQAEANGSDDGGDGDIEEGQAAYDPTGRLVEEGSQDRKASFGSEFGDEVFDDLGDLPSEFWEGKFESGIVDGGVGEA